MSETARYYNLSDDGMNMLAVMVTGWNWEPKGAIPPLRSAGEIWEILKANGWTRDRFHLTCMELTEAGYLDDFELGELR